MTDKIKTKKTSNFRAKLFSRGFSMFEVLIAVFVLAIIATGVVQLISSSVKHSMDSRDNIIAAELAQEGVELVRNVRDNNLASGNAAFNGMPGAPSADIANCRIDYLSGFLGGSCGVGVDRYVYIKNNFYSHDSSGTKTKFQRKIGFDYDYDSAKSLRMVSTVIWGRNAGDFPALPAQCTISNRCIAVEDILADR